MSAAGLLIFDSRPAIDEPQHIWLEGTQVQGRRYESALAVLEHPQKVVCLGGHS
jgi:hypothetical protein